MSTVPMSTKGRIVLPAAVRKALGLKPGMRVILELDGKGVRLTRALEKKTPRGKQFDLRSTIPGPWCRSVPCA